MLMGNSEPNLSISEQAQAIQSKPKQFKASLSILEQVQAIQSSQEQRQVRRHAIKFNQIHHAIVKKIHCIILSHSYKLQDSFRQQ